jgi:hypothetical protein
MIETIKKSLLTWKTENRTTPNESQKTLGSYRDCPGSRGRVEPDSLGRGSFDRIV